MKISEAISKYSSELKTVLYGIIWIIIAIIFWWHIAENPFDELNLILRAKITDGFIVDADEDILEGDRGESSWIHYYYYKYQIPDGRKFKGVERGSGRISIDLDQPHPIQFEYLPDNPDVSRINGSGSSDVWEWLWRKIGFGGLLLIMVISPGLVVMRNGIIDIRKKMKLAQRF